MEKYLIETICADEACRRLRAMGVSINPETVRWGIDQKVFPFGDSIQCEKGRRYIIYTKKFYEWAATVGVTREADD